MPTTPRMKPSLVFPRLATSLATSHGPSLPSLAPVPLACFQFLEQATLPPASGSLHTLVPLPAPPPPPAHLPT